MSSSPNALENLQVLEVFPQTRMDPQYFAEFGDKLPQKLKSGTNFFLLQAVPEPEESIPDVIVEEPPKKPKSKKRKAEEETIEQPVEESPIKKKSAKKTAATEPVLKLYLKATQDGVLGKKGELIEAQKIPSGTLLHLVKRKKYVKTMIFYENSWFEY